MSNEPTDARSLAARFIDSLEQRHWGELARLLHPDVVYEVPQTRERIVGRDRYVQFNGEYPGDWHLAPRVVLGDEAHAAVWFDWRVGEESSADGIVFFEVADGHITRITDFWPEPYEPPPGREHLTERY
ncbi:MAG: nuclear transport factor 2 family protein [Ilumatobacteraceae bacterium]